MQSLAVKPSQHVCALKLDLKYNEDRNPKMHVDLTCIIRCNPEDFFHAITRI